MNFVIENVSKSSGRLGQLVQLESAIQLKTPLLLQTTKSGSIPFLSREVFEYVSQDASHLLQFSLATMQDMTESLRQFPGGGASAFVGFPKSPALLMIRDPCEEMRSGGNDKDVVPLFSRHGKMDMSASRFIDMVETFAPAIYQGLSDADTNAESAKKRVQKSVERTEQFMDFCYEHHRSSTKLKNCVLFAPIVGGYNTFARTRSIKHAKANGGDLVGGYLLEGFHNYGLTATEVSGESFLPIVRHCLAELETDKPKMLPGAFTPLVILELVRLNVDMFDTSYAYCAAANFKALSFTFDLKANKAVPAANIPFLDLTDEELKEDFTPFLTGCTCLACTKHTRAYVHHLYKTNELLGPILLMIHNLHHYMLFFETIRSCIAEDSIPDLLKLVQFQGGDKEVDYRIAENTKVISRTGMGKGFVQSV